MLLLRCLWDTQLLMTSKHLKTWSGAQKKVWARDINFRFAFKDGNWSHVSIWGCLRRRCISSEQKGGYRTELRDTLLKGQRMGRHKKRLRKSRLSHGMKTKRGSHRKESLEEKNWSKVLNSVERLIQVYAV